MILVLTLLGCGSGTSERAPETARPEVVPADAVALSLGAEQVLLDGKAATPREAFEQDLTDGIDAALLTALPEGGDAAWIRAPGDTPWMLVRKLVVTADEAGRSRRWVGLEGSDTAYGPSRKPDANYRPTCPDGPVEVEGLTRRLSVEIFEGSDGTWVETSVTFAPRVDGNAALSLPDRCWSGASCDQLGELSEVCERARGAEPARRRVQVAGPIGCILPIRKEPGQEEAWPEELGRNLKGLGLTAADEATLLIEANAPWSTVVAVLEGFDRAGLPAPALGLPLVEGHGRPPLCTATVRDAATLDTASAKWFGSKLPADEEPAPASGRGSD